MLYNITLNVGRVQSPTLAMLVKREDEIANFIKEPFYTPTIELPTFAASGEKLKDKTVVEKIAAECKGLGTSATRAAVWEDILNFSASDKSAVVKT